MPPRKFAPKTSRAHHRTEAGNSGAEMKSRQSKSASLTEDMSKGDVFPQNGSFPVVAIGASAGGLEAYSELFRALPVDTGMAFVLIQHLDPSHRSMLTDIISKTTKMPVEEVKAKARIRPNRVYVIPPNALMSISAGAFILTPRSKDQVPHLSVNFFMRSLSEERKSKAIGVILSGTGSDGTLGLSAIRAEGGINFSQDLASAKYDGMPRSAIDSGCVDFVLPPREIARELTRITRHSFVSQVEDAPAAEPAQPAKVDFSNILDLLWKSSGVDFTQYKPNTIHRRSQRRMAILKLNSLGDYANHLKNHSEELQLLFEDILIPVTSFFRDFEAFELLKSHVYPAIAKDKGNKGPIRVWAPGCSTGEETYSLAITLLEFLGDKAANFQIQLFGTDLNVKGIQHARTGLYAEAIADEMSPERLRRFFIKEDGGYRVSKVVRDLCVFARQNLAADPPFSQMNLVACRNMLIYLSPALQKKIMPILHYSLAPSGFLVLGNAESASTYSNLFSPVDKKNKIYSKKPVASRLHYDFAQGYYPKEKGVTPASKSLAPSELERELNIELEADRTILKTYAPAGVVVNNALDVVQFRGRTAPYLESAPGKPSLNLLKLAREELAAELGILIIAAKKRNEPARKSNVRFHEGGHKKLVNLHVSLLGKNTSPPEERHFLVLFEEVTSQPHSGDGKVRQDRVSRGTAKYRQSERLNQELASTQDSLRSAMESEQATREEFQSANEEVMSANEELQSTNEELETSKEELQSANEELITLNDELRKANSELTALSNDISNFLNSTKIPVVMLDTALRIRRFTSTAEALLKVVASDVGRPIMDIKLNVRVPDLEQMILTVLDSLRPVEREVQGINDRWYSLQIQPYRTIDNKIDGVVLALMDIESIKKSNEQLRRSTEFLQGIVDTVRHPLLVLDSELRIISSNKSFLNDFKVASEITVNKFLYRISGEQWNIPKLRALLEDVLNKNQEVVDFEVQHEFKEIGPRTMLLTARKLFQRENREAMILLAIEDVTELRRSTEFLQGIVDTVRHPLLVLDSELRIIASNKSFLNDFKVASEITVNKFLYRISGEQWNIPKLRALLEDVLNKNQEVVDFEVQHEFKKIGPRTMRLNARKLFQRENREAMILLAIEDITERRRTQAALLGAEKLAAAGRVASLLAHEINNPLQAVTNLISLLQGSTQMNEQDQQYTTLAEQELGRVVNLVRQSLVQNSVS